MELYKKMYYGLFNAVTDAIEYLEHHEYTLALLVLENAQKTPRNNILLHKTMNNKFCSHFLNWYISG